MPTLNWIGKDKVLNHHWKYLFMCWKGSTALMKQASMKKITAART